MLVIGAGGGREAGCGQHVDIRKCGVGEKRTDVRGHEVGEKRVSIGAPTCGCFCWGVVDVAVTVISVVFVVSCDSTLAVAIVDGLGHRYLQGTDCEDHPLYASSPLERVRRSTLSSDCYHRAQLWHLGRNLQLKFAANSFGKARHVFSLTTRRAPARWPRPPSC
jgi:hypothetical protein